MLTVKRTVRAERLTISGVALIQRLELLVCASMDVSLEDWMTADTAVPQLLRDTNCQLSRFSLGHRSSQTTHATCQIPMKIAIQTRLIQIGSLYRLPPFSRAERHTYGTASAP